MPDRVTHVSWGMATGGCIAAYRARYQDSSCLIFETGGGTLGGYIGGRLPDIIEPATWYGHRKIAHSLAVGGSMTIGISQAMGQWEAWCRTKALQIRESRNQTPHNEIYNLCSVIAECLLHVLTGFLTGLAAGYISHLALDAGTPCSIPLLGIR